MNEHELSLFHLEKKDMSLKLKKGADFDVQPQLQYAPAPMPAPQLAAPSAPAPAVDAPAAAAPAPASQSITSPMVGTFYRKPSPDSPNFVEVGSAVKEGQTVCIIEAMKVMNEVKADKSGTIASIEVDDSTPVQFGDVLFTIK